MRALVMIRASAGRVLMLILRMSDMSTRYAIYFAPAQHSLLWQLGSRWLGRDAALDLMLEQPHVPGYAAVRVAALTRSPRLYGLHATLKAPFHLAPGQSLTALRDAITRLCAACTGFELPALEVSSLAGFLALRPATYSEALQSLATRCTLELDAFRRRPGEAELRRRQTGALTPRQVGLLHEYGYPYVLDQFHFHLTLTERLDTEAAAHLLPWLREYLRGALTEPQALRELCLFAQESPGTPFRILDRFSTAF